MASIIKGTTPTIKVEFKVVSVSEINTAILTFKQNNSIIIEKDLAAAEVGQDSISWTLSQEETLIPRVGESVAMVNWLTNDGTRGASKKNMFFIEGNHIEEVI